MSEFTAKVLYSHSDLESALENYKSKLFRAGCHLRYLTCCAEDRWEPTHEDILKGVIRAKYAYDTQVFNLAGYLDHEGLIDRRGVEWKEIKDLVGGSRRTLLLNRYEDEYHQITNLYGSGRDCYLTPAQAKFVNKFKDMEVL